MLTDNFVKRSEMSSRMQADDFLDAFHLLKDTTTHTIMGPSIVCLAFSVELYIKDVYFALGIKAPSGRDGHNILKLFGGLPKQTQKEIFTHDAISQNPFSTRGDIFSPNRFTSSYTAYNGFIDEIKAISRGFEKWRYSYESIALRYNASFAMSFIEAVKSVADAIRARSAVRLRD